MQLLRRRPARWTRCVLVFALGALASGAGEARDQPVELPLGAALRVARDVRVAPGQWLRPPLSDEAHANGTAGVIVAEGLRDATIDLRGVTLRGAEPQTPLDRLEGYGIVLRDCENVVVRGGKLGGYRACVVAERCVNLRIEGTEFDGYFAQRLASTASAENAADQLETRENERGEWLAQYGAAIALAECTTPVIAGCRARHGQNGLLLARTSGARVYGNDFSFLSGWGVALFRSSDNVIARNRLDFCVRGFESGAYARGFGAAGIVLTERSSDNVIAANSALHCGSGLWLFGGQDVALGRAAERGEQAPGGCDRNRIVRNDFSYAVAGAVVLALSSENVVLDNVATFARGGAIVGRDCAGDLIAGNDCSSALGRGIALERCAGVRIARNLLHGCEVAVDLRGGAARDPWVCGNSFAENDADLGIEDVRGLYFGDNVLAAAGGELHASELTLEAGESFAGEPRELLASSVGLYPSGRLERVSLRPLPAELPVELTPAFALELAELPGGGEAIDAARARGFERIVVGEWGPWDFEAGEARPGARATGGALAGATWSARWFSWARGPDPRSATTSLEAWRALADEPLIAADVTAWTSPWAARDDIRLAAGNERVGLIAKTTVELAAGDYVLRTTSDDGVRVLVDGAVALENWSWHAATVDEARITLSAGTHAFVLEWFQIDGAAALTLELERK